MVGRPRNNNAITESERVLGVAGQAELDEMAPMEGSGDERAGPGKPAFSAARSCVLLLQTHRTL